MFKLIFQSAPIELIFGQIGYWDVTRQCIFYFFNFSIISVITILPKKGQNTENTTFLHVKMTVVQGCARAKIFRIVFYGQNDPKTVKKKACTLVLESSKINLNTLGIALP